MYYTHSLSRVNISPQIMIHLQLLFGEFLKMELNETRTLHLQLLHVMDMIIESCTKYVNESC